MTLKVKASLKVASRDVNSYDIILFELYENKQE